MKTIYFTSDHHFGHKNIIGYCDRPFESVEQMDAEMIRRWNWKVTPADEVYYLGDLAFAEKDRIREILSQLHGTKHLLLGNHDERHSTAFWYKAGFETVSDERECEFEGLGWCYLRHYPVYFNHSGIQIHGHTHNNRGMDPIKYYSVTKQIQVNVSVEVWSYFPASLEEIIHHVNLAKEQYHD